LNILGKYVAKNILTLYFWRTYNKNVITPGVMRDEYMEPVTTNETKSDI
jgi:hypothetical protein